MRVIIFCIFIALALAQNRSQPCKIAFRMDDLQDYWLNSVQSDVVAVFQRKQFPLTLGIIGHYIGTDPFLVNYLQSSRWGNGNWE